MNIPSPVSELQFEFLKQRDIQLCLKRDDLIHPEISGNKWRKLKYNLKAAHDAGRTEVLTFGGAYSNHIVATAAAANQQGLKSIGLIRGDSFVQNHSLNFAKSQGMELFFLDRSEYRDKENPEFLNKWKARYPNAFFIPEGGRNEEGVKGCSELYEELDSSFDFICCAAGTGTTAAGLLRSLREEKLIVFPALKNASFLKEEILDLAAGQNENNLILELDFHFGGYAKITKELIDFYRRFKQSQNIDLDLIYTSKMMFGLQEIIKRGQIPKGSKVLAIHTGGVQGNASLLSHV